jgi:hypothetical protein
MRYGVLFVGALLMLLATAGAFAATQFDGRWGVTLTCPDSPDGARGFTFEFSANVVDAVLHGERGARDHPGWMALDGRIQPSGDANLEAHGLTGNPRYNIKNTRPSVPYRHAVTAHFEATRGTGIWVTPRTCKFTFVKL